MNECDGFETFRSSGGFHLSKRHKRIFNEVIRYKPHRVIDIGCGRGEVALKFAINGCSVWACDFSKDAVKIAEELKKRWESKNSKVDMKVVLADAVKLGFEDGFFDAAIMVDVVEHMDYNKSLSVFKECRRIIKKGGRLFIHTSPGKLFINYGLELYRIVAYFMGYKFDCKLKQLLPSTLKPPYHITEWSSSMFKKSLLECGFREVRVSFWKNPHYAYYFTSDDRFMNAVRIISKLLPWKELFFADIFVSALV